MPSSTVKNYLKAILVLSGGKDASVTTGAIAKALKVTAPTATTMSQSMAARGLLEYLPRKGVHLSPEGRTQALAVLRKHRLVEAYLVRILKVKGKDVRKEADTLEHAISDRVLARIDSVLGDPDASPHGDITRIRKA
jgi:DtxR family transcriptional regulator, Mn-dependent transcriptional regulator